MYIRKYPLRFLVVFVFFFCALALLFVKLFLIQFFKADFLTRAAQKQHNYFLELESKRGSIYDRNAQPLALNLPSQSLYAVPVELANVAQAVQKLSAILHADKSFFQERLSRKKSFVWLARKLSHDRYLAVKKLGLSGLGFREESKRYYPNARLSSHVIGFAGMDNFGLEGLELHYDEYLRGKSGWCFIIRDAKLDGLLLEQELTPPRDGYDITLTLDENIQFIVERELDAGLEKYRARAGSIIMMNPATGEILAMANRPTFNPNETDYADTEHRRNRAVTDFYEPGSVFKIVTASAALEEGKVTEEDIFFCEHGKYRVANNILHDHTPHGNLTFREVIEESSNIGVTKVAQILGPDIIYRYMELFGFGSLTGVDLPGEVAGIIKKPSEWSRTSIGAMPMGHEVTVTGLQLICALSAIANNGIDMKPFVVKYIRDKQGELIKEFTPNEVRRVISEETAQRMRSILTGAVENGTGKNAKIKGLRIAGKTGTAQKVEGKAYSHTKYVATFMGFIYDDNGPILSMVVIFDEPRAAHFGGTVSAPVFKRIATDTVRYLENVNKRPATVMVPH